MDPFSWNKKWFEIQKKEKTTENRGVQSTILQIVCHFVHEIGSRIHHNLII